MISKFSAPGKIVGAQATKPSLLQMNNAGADGADGGFGAILNQQATESRTHDEDAMAGRPLRRRELRRVNVPQNSSPYAPMKNRQLCLDPRL